MERAAADNPFPGMDPYLEQPGRWRGFHVAFLTNLMAELNAGLPEPYTADLEESVQLVELDVPSLREAIPDGSVTRGPGPAGRSAGPSAVAAAAVLAPVVLAHPAAAEVKERWVEVRSSPGRELVAVIELLSPTNKGDGRTDYLRKRVALMRQQVHLVEVDLLLGGKRLPMLQPLPAGDYFAVVSRADRRPTGDVYGWPAARRLPAIPIPLRRPDADHLVDLQAVFDVTYRAAAYRRKLDYARPLGLALPEALEPWVAEVAARAKATRVNVALVILHADPAKGGAETYTVDLAAALAGRGHAVSLLAASFADAIDPRVARVPLSFTGPTRTGRYARFLAGLDAHLAAVAARAAADGGSGGGGYDVVHAMLPVRRCDLYHPHAGVAAEAVARGHLKHESPVRRAAARLANRLNRKRRRFAAVERALLEPSAAAGAAAGHIDGPPVVLCLSDYIKGTIRRHYPGLPDGRLATLFNAVDVGRFDPAEPATVAAGREVRARHGVRPDQVVALMVAQDFARKGLREAVEAWRLVADDRLVLMVVGKDDFAPYAALAAGAPFPRTLVYAGATRDVRPFYAAADLFVLPTRHDPCSLVVLEALAMGLPVVSTRFNGACEVMTGAGASGSGGGGATTAGAHGFVLPDPADVPALAAALRRLLDDPARAAMSRACLALRPRLAYGHHLDELERLYARVTGGR